MTSYLAEIFDIVPSDKASQFNSWMLISEMVERNLPNAVLRVLDLGCGNGRSFDMFNQFFPACSWVGLDIEGSPEVRSRHREDCEFISYNGTDIPFPQDEFDVVYSNQVFEHVRYPEKLLTEVHRVLKTGGYFVGSVSYLEPYHSFSLFNFTPYGWYQVQSACGLQPELLAAGIDSLALIGRSLDLTSVDNSVWSLSPLNQAIIDDPNLSIKQKNYKMLMYAGHIVFISRK